MAAIETLGRRAMTFGDREELSELTTQGKSSPEPSAPEPQFVRPPWQGRLWTGPHVEPDERGNKELYNEAEYLDGVHLVATEETPGDDGQAARVRSELARQLLGRVEQLSPLVGDVSLPTNIQLLKRDLSRCHDALRHHPTESNFLSIITLVESAVTQTRWKEYSRSQLDRIRSAFEVGYRQPHVDYDDYDRIRRAFGVDGIDTHPRIDLESLSLEDLADAEED